VIAALDLQGKTRFPAVLKTPGAGLAAVEQILIDPVLALSVAVVGGAALAVLFWPGAGLFWRLLRLLRTGDRVLIEDALKQLHDCEYRNVPCTLQGLSGALGLSDNRVARLLRELEQTNLVQPDGGRYRLTPDGRSYALRVVRTHRLWEHYLAERTGLDASEWHAEAHVLEHRTSPEEAEKLAARMGWPRYDPHGDPIPTPEGEIAPPLGRPMTEFGPGQSAEIVHVEDQPEAVYAQLVAEGLHPGTRVRVLESGPQRVRLEADGEEHLLAPVVAANLSAVELPEEQAPEGPLNRLSGLPMGGRARVTGFSAMCRGPERRRMFDLGLVPGTVVEAELRSPAGDPTAYRIRGAMIALRRSQADLIYVEPFGGESAQ
jgi:DtxR family Mn-dependent transcriptional regulator